MRTEYTRQELKKMLVDSTVLFDLFDRVRVIQGKTHKICKMNDEGTIIPCDELCYEIWNRNEVCSNCASRKACDMTQKMVKLEYVDENFYFVIATPITVDGEPYSLELISNITSNMTMAEGTVAPGNFVHDLLCQLEKISEQEAFTGLYNKNYLEKNVTARIEEAQKNNKHIYLAIFDIDDFKTINDVYGHIQGDEVILKFVEILRDVLPFSKDVIAARFGGDEFAVVFEGYHREECDEFLNEICERFANHEFKTQGATYHVTISYGLAEIHQASDFGEAISYADKKLYKAKEINKKRTR